MVFQDYCAMAYDDARQNYKKREQSRTISLQLKFTRLLSFNCWQHWERLSFSYKVVGNLIAEVRSLKASFTSAISRQSFCRSNLAILYIYLSKRFASFWQLHQKCLYVSHTGKEIMKLIKL